MEFGRRWFVTLLEGGYIIGGPCRKIGGDTDGKIAEEILPQFRQVLGKMPSMFVYDFWSQCEQIDQGFKRRCSDSGGSVMDRMRKDWRKGYDDGRKTQGLTEKETLNPKCVFFNHHFPDRLYL